MNKNERDATDLGGYCHVWRDNRDWLASQSEVCEGTRELLFVTRWANAVIWRELRREGNEKHQQNASDILNDAYLLWYRLNWATRSKVAISKRQHRKAYSSASCARFALRKYFHSCKATRGGRLTTDVAYDREAMIDLPAHLDELTTRVAKLLSQKTSKSDIARLLNICPMRVSRIVKALADAIHAASCYRRPKTRQADTLLNNSPTWQERMTAYLAGPAECNPTWSLPPHVDYGSHVDPPDATARCVELLDVSYSIPVTTRSSGWPIGYFGEASPIPTSGKSRRVKKTRRFKKITQDELDELLA